MISLQEYRANPCGILSIPYWKAKTVSVPLGLEIVHHSQFREEMAEGRQDSRFFRLRHPLRPVPQPGPAPSGVEFAPISADRAGELTDMINRCYGHSGISVTEEEVHSWAKTQVYCPELWIGAFEDGVLAGSLIGEFDPEAGEAVYRACGFMGDDVWHILR